VWILWAAKVGTMYSKQMVKTEGDSNLLVSNFMIKWRFCQRIGAFVSNLSCLCVCVCVCLCVCLCVCVTMYVCVSVGNINVLYSRWNILRSFLISFCALLRGSGERRVILIVNEKSCYLCIRVSPSLVATFLSWNTPTSN